MDSLTVKALAGFAKNFVSVSLALILLCLCGCGPSDPSTVDPALKRFAKAEKAEARAMVTQQKLTLPRGAWSFFDASIEGHWQKASNTYAGFPGSLAAVPGSPKLSVLLKSLVGE